MVSDRLMNPQISPTNFNERPFIAIWEVTQACDPGHVHSRTGEVFPGCFLPQAAGNIRKQELADIYRDLPLFSDLRDTLEPEGKCESAEICGGLLARTYVLTENPHAEEPCCSYVAKGYVLPALHLKTIASLHVLQGA